MNTKNKELEQPDDRLDDFEDFEDLDEIRDGASDLLHALHVAELAASVLELAKQTPVTSKRRLELVRQVVLNVAPLIEDYDAYVSGDISVNFVEYLDFKLTDDGTDATGWTKGYEEQVEKALQELIPRLKQKLREFVRAQSQ